VKKRSTIKDDIIPSLVGVLGGDGARDTFEAVEAMQAELYGKIAPVMQSKRYKQPRSVSIAPPGD